MNQSEINPNGIDPPAPPAATLEASASSPKSSVREMWVAPHPTPVDVLKPGRAGLHRLGYNQQQMLEILPLSERTLFNMRQCGEIPFVKVRDRILYPVDDIHAWWDGLRERGGN
jgi:hypothetical protein